MCYFLIPQYIPLVSLYPPLDFESFIIFVHPFSDITIYLFIIYNICFPFWHNFIMHSSVLHHEYLLAYSAAKNGSVFKTIPEIDRTNLSGWSYWTQCFLWDISQNLLRETFFWDRLYERRTLRKPGFPLFLGVSDAPSWGAQNPIPSD